MKTWFIILMLLCLIGLCLMWKYKKFKKIGLIAISVIIIVELITNGIVNILIKRNSDSLDNNKVIVQKLYFEDSNNLAKKNIRTLNISLPEVKIFFEDQDFKFRNSPLNDGTPRILAAEGPIEIEVQGNDKLIKATMTSYKLNKKILNNNILFVKKICPQFQEDDLRNWINEIVNKNDEKKNFRVFGNTKVIACTHKSMDCLVVTIEPN